MTVLNGESVQGFDNATSQEVHRPTTNFRAYTYRSTIGFAYRHFGFSIRLHVATSYWNRNRDCVSLSQAPRVSCFMEYFTVDTYESERN